MVSTDEVRQMLPPGCELLDFKPTTVPFRTNFSSTVVNQEKFIRSYMRDLGTRLKTPSTMACDSLAIILDKLQSAGVHIRLKGNHDRNAEV